MSDQNTTSGGSNTGLIVGAVGVVVLLLVLFVWSPWSGGGDEVGEVSGTATEAVEEPAAETESTTTQ